MFETFQQHGIDCCVGGHNCPDRFNEQTYREECVDATVCAKQQAQSVAFTTHHPAYRRYIALEGHLSQAESQAVDRRCPGKGTVR